MTLSGLLRGGSRLSRRMSGRGTSVPGSGLVDAGADLGADESGSSERENRGRAKNNVDGDDGDVAGDRVSAELRAALEHAVLRESNKGSTREGGSKGDLKRTDRSAPTRGKGKDSTPNRKATRPSSGQDHDDSDDIARLKAALRAVAQHAAVEGRRAAVLLDGGDQLADALRSAAESRRPTLLRLGALVFARLSAEADAAAMLASTEYLVIVDAALAYEVVHHVKKDSALHPNFPTSKGATEQDVANASEARRLAARGARNLAAFDAENAVAIARNSDTIRLLLAVIQDGIASVAASTETVEATAAIANLARHGQKFQAYIRKHNGLALLASAAQQSREPSLVFHAVRALAEFSLEHRWQVQLIAEGVVTVALAIIGSSGDPEITSEATRCVGNIACSRTGRENILAAGGVELIARRIVVMTKPSAGDSTSFRVKGHEERLAADLLRAMSNLCVGNKEASHRAIASGGMVTLISACDRESMSARSRGDDPTLAENIASEAFRGLLIIAQAGPSFRANVLREIGARIRKDVAVGRCTAQLYDLSRRIKVEASAERKDDVPQTIAGLGAASKDYMLQVFGSYMRDGKGDVSKTHNDPTETANTLPGMRSPSTSLFRQSGRVLSVQRPQKHRSRLERERRLRKAQDSSQPSDSATPTGHRSNEASRSRSASQSNEQGVSEDGGYESSSLSIPRCKVVDVARTVPANATAVKDSERKEGSHTVQGGPLLTDLLPLASTLEDWSAAVWSLICQPLKESMSNSNAEAHASHPEDEEMTEDVFEIGTPLGRGGFATVFLARNLRTGELVAVKRFHPVASALPDAKKKAELAARRAMKEQRIWDGLEHKNIVGYRGCFFGEEGELNMVAEYIPGWSLADHLSQIQKFPEHLVAKITRQIVDGIDYLHREGVTHRDVKPANILVHPNGTIKITDFGVSSALDVPTMTGNTLVGTPWYIAPEMIEGRPYGKSVDIWSLGCTVLELATGRRPYHELRAHEALFRIAKDRQPPPIPRDVNPQLRDFLLTCWVWDPEKRPLTPHLKRHPFLANLGRDSASAGAVKNSRRET